MKKHFGDVFVKATKGRLNGGNYEHFSIDTGLSMSGKQTYIVCDLNK